MLEKALTVSALNDYLKDLVDTDIVLNNLVVEGEISNFKKSTTGGHWYFTLKDATAQVSCVVFANFAVRLKYTPQDGDLAQARGKLVVFNKRGSYSLQVYFLEPAGLGDLARAFEMLKEKLTKAGLFAPERKKPIPPYPRKIAVLAAPEGAAIHDIITVAKRRDPGLEIHLYPTLVQGDSAVSSIIENLNLAQEVGDYDVIVLARGGGSLEDLQAFNTEEVARSVAACRLPTVSAVGHEVDFTITDFAADLRAATPSVAAELIVPDKIELRQKIDDLADFLQRGLERLLADQYQELDYGGQRLDELLQRILEKAKENCRYLADRLDDLNPLQILKRGFALVEKDGQPVMSVKKIQKDDIITIRMRDGRADAEVREIYDF
ncbi:MAG: exodeoxyribonuclease VII large subunit [Candidatus Margulisbacteria bacterium]|jgi:exodeoxyribonuclease VII large subunit|nr:exodeoxyribonuclease VII large subunit [Candidatus Margulisiibacteriota bacterium]